MAATIPPRRGAARGAGSRLRREPALFVPLMYLQAATLPPADLSDVYTIAANFSLVDGSWNKWRARIDRARRGRIYSSDDEPTSEFAHARYPVATLLTISNPLPTDAVIFHMMRKRPVTNSEKNEDDVVRVLAGDRKVKWYDAWAAWFNTPIARHAPDAPKMVLRDMKPYQVILVFEEK